MVDIPGLEDFGKSTRHGVLVWFPPGTKGEREEIEVIEFMHAHRELGYGRMIQMLDQMWRFVDDKHVPASDIESKNRNLEKLASMIDRFCELHAAIFAALSHNPKFEMQAKFDLAFEFWMLNLKPTDKNGFTEPDAEHVENIDDGEE